MADSKSREAQGPLNAAFPFQPPLLYKTEKRLLYGSGLRLFSYDHETHKSTPLPLTTDVFLAAKQKKDGVTGPTRLANVPGSPSSAAPSADAGAPSVTQEKTAAPIGALAYNNRHDVLAYAEMWSDAVSPNWLWQNGGTLVEAMATRAAASGVPGTAKGDDAVSRLGQIGTRQKGTKLLSAVPGSAAAGRKGVTTGMMTAGFGGPAAAPAVKRPLVAIADAATNKIRKIITTDEKGEDRDVQAFVHLSFSPDGQFLLAISAIPDASVYIYQWEKGRLYSVFRFGTALMDKALINGPAPGTVSAANLPPGATGSSVAVNALAQSSFPAIPLHSAWHPDGQDKVVITGRNVFKVFHVTDRTLRPMGIAQAFYPKLKHQPQHQTVKEAASLSGRLGGHREGSARHGDTSHHAATMDHPNVALFTRPHWLTSSRVVAGNNFGTICVLEDYEFLGEFDVTDPAFRFALSMDEVGAPTGSDPELDALDHRKKKVGTLKGLRMGTASSAALPAASPHSAVFITDMCCLSFNALVVTTVTGFVGIFKYKTSQYDKAQSNVSDFWQPLREWFPSLSLPSPDDATEAVMEDALDASATSSALTVDLHGPSLPSFVAKKLYESGFELAQMITSGMPAFLKAGVEMQFRYANQQRAVRLQKSAAARSARSAKILPPAEHSASSSVTSSTQQLHHASPNDRVRPFYTVQFIVAAPHQNGFAFVSENGALTFTPSHPPSLEMQPDVPIQTMSKTDLASLDRPPTSKDHRSRLILQAVSVPSHHGSVRQVVYCPRNSMVYSFSNQDGILQVRDGTPSDGSASSEARGASTSLTQAYRFLFPPVLGRVTSFAVHPSGHFVAFFWDQKVTICSILTSDLVPWRHIKVMGGCRGLYFSTNGAMLAVIGHSGSCSIYPSFAAHQRDMDLANSGDPAQFTEMGIRLKGVHEKQIKGAVWSSDDRFLYTFDEEGQLVQWLAASGKHQWTWSLDPDGAAEQIVDLCLLTTMEKEEQQPVTTENGTVLSPIAIKRDTLLVLTDDNVIWRVVDGETLERYSYDYYPLRMTCLSTLGRTFPIVAGFANGSVSVVLQLVSKPESSSKKSHEEKGEMVWQAVSTQSAQQAEHCLFVHTSAIKAMTDSPAGALFVLGEEGSQHVITIAPSNRLTESNTILPNERIKVMLARKLVDQQNEDLTYWQMVLEEEAKTLEEDLMATDLSQAEKQSAMEAIWAEKQREMLLAKANLDKQMAEEAAEHHVALTKLAQEAKERDEREHTRMASLLESQAVKQSLLEGEVAFVQDSSQRRLQQIREAKEAEMDRLTRLFNGMIRDLERISEEHRTHASQSDTAHQTGMQQFDRFVSAEQLNIITEATKQIMDKRESYQPNVQENQVLKADLEEQQATLARLKKEEANQTRAHQRLKKETAALEAQIQTLRQTVTQLDTAIVQKEQQIDKASEEYKVQEYHYSVRQEEEARLDAIVDPKRRYLKDLKDRSENVTHGLQEATHSKESLLLQIANIQTQIRGTLHQSEQYHAQVQSFTDLLRTYKSEILAHLYAASHLATTGQQQEEVPLLEQWLKAESDGSATPQVYKDLKAFTVYMSAKYGADDGLSDAQRSVVFSQVQTPEVKATMAERKQAFYTNEEKHLSRKEQLDHQAHVASLRKMQLENAELTEEVNQLRVEKEHVEQRLAALAQQMKVEAAEATRHHGHHHASPGSSAFPPAPSASLQREYDYLASRDGASGRTARHPTGHYPGFMVWTREPTAAPTSAATRSGLRTRTQTWDGAALIGETQLKEKHKLPHL